MLLSAQRELDRTVNAAYSRRKLSGEADRVAFLFEESARLGKLFQNKAKRKYKRA